MRRRLLGGFLFVFFLVMSISVDAYADSPSIANPTCQPSYVTQNDYVVYPVSNRYDATLVLLGEWYKKIQITQDMYVKLSNPESGGHFYELASHFSNGYDPPSWSDAVANPLGAIYWLNAWTYIAWNIGEPWEDYLWWVHAEDYEISQAKADLQTILDGGSLGPSGGVNSDLLTTSYNRWTSSISSASGITVGNVKYTNDVLAWSQHRDDPNVALMPLNLSITTPSSFFSDRPAGAEDYDVVWIADIGSSRYAKCLLLPPGSWEWSSDIVTADGVDYTRYTTLTFRNGGYRYGGYRYGNNSTSSMSIGYNFDGSSINVVANADDVTAKWQSLSGSGTYSGGNAFVGGVAAGGGGGSGGDNHWPDPVPPSPPDPPDPNPEPDPDPPDPGPGIDLPDVDFPDITIEGSSSSVSFPTINVESPSITVNPPTNTTSSDYTPWLSAILSALNSIISDLDSHCQHLRQAIKTYSEALGNSINASLDSHCQHLRQAIKDYTEALASSVHDDLEYFYNDLTAYLAELAQWLVEHLNWSVDVQSPDVTVPSFDDSGIVAWLKRIYFKLGGTSQRKPDPITETGDALDWWSALLQWIANALSGFITTFVGDVGAVVEGVLTRFPFSIPWDILAYLTLLDAERVTPVIVVTVPAVTGWWSQFSVTIDLSAYNLAMATVRSMMLVWWGFVLVMRTDWILLVMGRTGAELATGFVSRLVGNGGD